MTEENETLEVLVIDDDSFMLHLCTTMILRGGKYGQYTPKVTTAGGGKKGLELYEEMLGEGMPYDVVITDLNMPLGDDAEVDGADVTKRIKKLSSETLSRPTPVYVVTGEEDNVQYATLKDKLGALSPELSPDDIIKKPIKKEELSGILNLAAEKKTNDPITYKTQPST